MTLKRFENPTLITSNVPKFPAIYNKEKPTKQAPLTKDPFIML